MKKPISEDPYRIINLVFILVILSVFAYSFFYGFPGKKHPVPSNSELLTGKPSVSTGLSRSFSAIVWFRFREAVSFNPYGIRIFLFFLLQFVMRVSGFFLVRKLNRGKLVRLDITFSVVLFLVLFWPFLGAFFKSLNILV